MTKKQALWAQDAKDTALKLHAVLRLDDKNWHQLKGNNERRAAELLAASIVQLSSNGENEDILNLIEQARKFLNHEVKDKGCPRS